MKSKLSPNSEAVREYLEDKVEPLRSKKDSMVEKMKDVTTAETEKFELKVEDVKTVIVDLFGEEDAKKLFKTFTIEEKQPEPTSNLVSEDADIAIAEIQPIVDLAINTETPPPEPRKKTRQFL